jgi:hypothetical protein
MGEPTIEIFDPPMCCPGGLCGPAIDPALLAANEAVLKLKSDRGILVHRYLLQQQGQKFMQNPEVMDLLRAHGTSVLPITVLDGRVVRQRSFPGYEDLVAYAGGATASGGRNENEGDGGKGNS